MNDAAQRAEIQRYVYNAFLAKIMQMNDVRRKKTLELRGDLGRRGHSMNSSAWMIGEVEIEEDCIADLLRQKADIYIEAYERVGLRIGPEVLKDLAHSQVELTAARKSSLIGSSQLAATRTYRPQDMAIYGHLGKKASVAMKEIEASIDLFNLSHPANTANGPRVLEKGKEAFSGEQSPSPQVQSERTRDHPDDQSHGDELGRPKTPGASNRPAKETIWTKMWSWVVVGAVDLFVFGGAIAFMTSGHAGAADGFFAGGTALFLAKFWTWEDARRQLPPGKWALQVAAPVFSLGIAILAIHWNHAINPAAATGHQVQSTIGRVPTTQTVPADRAGQHPAHTEPRKDGETPTTKSGTVQATGIDVAVPPTAEGTITIAERVKVIIAHRLQVPPAKIRLNDDFEVDLGSDPGDVYFLMRDLELEYGIVIPPSDSKNLHTVGETIDYIERKDGRK